MVFLVGFIVQDPAFGPSSPLPDPIVNLNLGVLFTLAVSSQDGLKSPGMFSYGVVSVRCLIWEWIPYGCDSGIYR